MSTLYVDNLEPNLGSQVEIPDLKPLAGSVVQVVQATSTTPLTLTAGGVVWTNAGAALNITPTSSSNKILVLNSATGIVSQSTSGSLSLRLVRNLNDGNGDTVTDAHRSRQGYQASGQSYIPINWDINYLDSPNTTNQVTYRIQIAQEQSGNLRYNDTDSSSGYGSRTWSRSMLIGLEIAQ